MSKGFNTLMELNGRLFEQLDSITNPDLQGEQLKAELERNDAVIDLARVIVDNAALCLKASMARENMVNELPKMLE